MKKQIGDDNECELTSCFEKWNCASEGYRCSNCNRIIAVPNQDHTLLPK